VCAFVYACTYVCVCVLVLVCMCVGVSVDVCDSCMCGVGQNRVYMTYITVKMVIFLL